MSLHKQLLNLGAFGLVLCMASTSALAHGDAHGIVKERMDGMVGMASQFKIIGQMALGRTVFDAGIAGAAADELAIRAFEIPHLFPQGSEGAPSDARLTIWQDWETFEMLSETLAIAGQQLSIAAPTLESAEDLRPHFDAIGRSCKGCHAEFRN